MSHRPGTGPGSCGFNDSICRRLKFKNAKNQWWFIAGGAVRKEQEWIPKLLPQYCLKSWGNRNQAADQVPRQNRLLCPKKRPELAHEIMRSKLQTRIGFGSQHNAYGKNTNYCHRTHDKSWHPRTRWDVDDLMNCTPECAERLDLRKIHGVQEPFLSNMGTLWKIQKPKRKISGSPHSNYGIMHRLITAPYSNGGGCNFMRRVAGTWPTL